MKKNKCSHRDIQIVQEQKKGQEERNNENIQMKKKAFFLQAFFLILLKITYRLNFLPIFLLPQKVVFFLYFPKTFWIWGESAKFVFVNKFFSSNLQKFMLNISRIFDLSLNILLAKVFTYA